MIRRLAPALLLVLVPCVAAQADDGVAAPPVPAETKPAETKAAAEWFADFDKAVERAKAEKKDLLVDFTGSDWCGWCIRLHDEVLKHDAFLGAAAKEYVLVSLDFPHGEEAKAKVPSADRNKELATKYGVEGFPTVLLMTADGDVFARTGYQEGGPEKYLEHMNSMRASNRPGLAEAIAIAAAVEGAKDDARSALLEKAVAKALAAPEGAAWVEKLLPAVKAAVAADADNAKGMKAGGMKVLLKAGPADEAVLTEAKALDPKNEKGLLELVVLSRMRVVRDLDGVRSVAQQVDELVPLGFKDKDTQVHLLVNAAVWQFQHLNDKAKAAALATKLKEVADPKNERLQNMIATILAGGGEEKDDDGEDEDDEEDEKGPEAPGEKAPKGPEAGPEKGAK